MEGKKRLKVRCDVSIVLTYYCWQQLVNMYRGENTYVSKHIYMYTIVSHPSVIIFNAPCHHLQRPLSSSSTPPAWYMQRPAVQCCYKCRRMDARGWRMDARGCIDKLKGHKAARQLCHRGGSPPPSTSDHRQLHIKTRRKSWQLTMGYEECIGPIHQQQLLLVVHGDIHPQVVLLCSNQVYEPTRIVLREWA